MKTDTDVRQRPVMFLWNGGPGYASAWLNLGAIGPWRIDLEAAARAPSLTAPAIDNPQSWLEFTDLVFIDPAGTGFGRIPGVEQMRNALWGVEGDVVSLAAAVRRWLVNNGRLASPKFIGGESYGGFRSPKVARRLVNEEGIPVNGLVLISPVLDFMRFNSRDILRDVARLPTYAAVAMDKAGPVTEAQMAPVEAYAQGEFISDLLKGYGDAAAMERLTNNVTKLTGLDRALVARLGARVPASVFTRQIQSSQGRVVSMYDGTFSGLNPNPFSNENQADDQLLLGLHAPLSSAMVEIYRTKLDWLPLNTRYKFHNANANAHWNWGRREEQTTCGRSGPQPVAGLEHAGADRAWSRRSRHALFRIENGAGADASPGGARLVFKTTTADTCSIPARTPAGSGARMCRALVEAAAGKPGPK